MFPPTLPILHTQRLMLRRMILADAPEVLFLRSDAQVNKYIKRKTPQNIADAEAFVHKIDKEIEQQEALFWAICLPENQQMIGSICLWNFSEDFKKAEVGYDLHPAFHRKGIMSEALTRVLDFGFETLDIDRIEAYTEGGNDSSQYLLRKHHFNLIEDRKDEDNSKNCIFELKKGGRH